MKVLDLLLYLGEFAAISAVLSSTSVMINPGRSEAIISASSGLGMVARSESGLMAMAVSGPKASTSVAEVTSLEAEAPVKDILSGLSILCR